MDLVDRPLYMDRIAPFVDAPFVKVLTGLRRSGKSRLLQLTAQHLRRRGVSPRRIVYLNFDSFELSDLRSARALHEYLSSVMPEEGRCYVLLDEIQEVEEWERLVNSLASNDRTDVYLTGSNSRIFSGELATYIAGRYKSIHVWPLSFREYREFAAKYSERNPAGIDEQFQRYVRLGGFPGLHSSASLDESDVLSTVTDIYQSTLIRDVLTRHSIRDADMFERVAAFALGNIGNPFSARRVADFMKSQRRRISHETVINYMAALAEAFVIAKVPRFDVHGKNILATDQKYYAGDHGIVNALFGYSDKRLPGLLENIVWMELRRRGFEVRIGWVGAAEVDFVATRQNEKLYIQVATTIAASSETKRREYAPLEAIKDNYPKYVLTMDPLAKDDSGGIFHRRVPDFLLSEDW